MTQYLLDVNVWMAFAIETHLHNRRADGWIGSIRYPDSLLFCRATQQSFLRLLTNAAVLRSYGEEPLTNEVAWRTYDRVLADTRIVCVANDPPELEAMWRDYSARPVASVNLWMDAYLAAFARATGSTFVTFDQAFRQFDGLDLLLLE